MLFSATSSVKVDELAKAALHSDPIKIGVAADQKNGTDDDDKIATVEGLEQVCIYYLQTNNSIFNIIYILFLLK